MMRPRSFSLRQMAASLLILLPVIALFLVGRKFFVSGPTVGAVKG